MPISWIPETPTLAQCSPSGPHGVRGPLLGTYIRACALRLSTAKRVSPMEGDPLNQAQELQARTQTGCKTDSLLGGSKPLEIRYA